MESAGSHHDETWSTRSRCFHACKSASIKVDFSQPHLGGSSEMVSPHWLRWLCVVRDSDGDNRRPSGSLPLLLSPVREYRRCQLVTHLPRWYRFLGYRIGVAVERAPIGGTSPVTVGYWEVALAPQFLPVPVRPGDILRLSVTASIGAVSPREAQVNVPQVDGFGISVHFFPRPVLLVLFIRRFEVAFEALAE